MATAKTRPPREWRISDLQDFGKKSGADYRKAVPVLILEQCLKGEKKEDGTGYVWTEQVKKRLEDCGLVTFEPKGSGSLLGSLTMMQKSRNLTSPILITYEEQGRFWLNLPRYEPLLQEYRRWYRENYPEDYKKLFPSEEPQRETPTELMGIIQVLEQYDRKWQAKLEESETRVGELEKEIERWHEQERSLTEQKGKQLSFLHTSPDFPKTGYDKKVTSIKETIEQMLKRARSSIRISTRQIDMFEDELIRLKRQNSALNITVLSRGPEKAVGPRKQIAGQAFQRMKAAGIRLPVETDLLHSRMVIVDEREVLVSSADLDYTQMEKEFNAGIWTNNPDVATEATRFFDNLLQSPTIKGS